MFAGPAKRAQGVALEYGKGRVIALGEAAVLRSQVVRGGGREFHFGMSHPGYDDRQLALSIAFDVWLQAQAFKPAL